MKRGISQSEIPTCGEPCVACVAPRSGSPRPDLGALSRDSQWPHGSRWPIRFLAVADPLNVPHTNAIPSPPYHRAPAALDGVPVSGRGLVVRRIDRAADRRCYDLSDGIVAGEVTALLASSAGICASPARCRDSCHRASRPSIVVCLLFTQQSTPSPQARTSLVARGRSTLEGSERSEHNAKGSTTVAPSLGATPTLRLKMSQSMEVSQEWQ